MTPCNVIHFNQIGICQGAGFLSEFARLERFGAQVRQIWGVGSGRGRFSMSRV
jgi:hypothetical protein